MVGVGEQTYLGRWATPPTLMADLIDSRGPFW